MGDYVLVRCHCGQFSETVQLRDSIPVDKVMCHCDSCRQKTGAMTYTGLALASPPIEAFKTKLDTYTISGKLLEYFCPTCGSHVGYHVVEEDRWNVSSGAVDQVIGDKKGQLEKIVGHEFVADTRDGGLVRCFPGTTLYTEHEGQELMSDATFNKMLLRDEGAPSQPSGTLQAGCRCGKVSFSLSRPDERRVT